MLKILTSSAIAALCCLTGCTGMNHHFDCPLASGMHCQAIHTVHHAINNQPEQKPLHVWVAKYQDERGTTHPAHNLIFNAKVCPCH